MQTRQQVNKHQHQPGFLLTSSLMLLTLPPVKTWGKRAEWLCCYRVCTRQCIHMQLHTWARTYTLTLSPLSPRAVKEAPPLGQVLADVLSVLALGWYFGFQGLYLKWLRYFRVWGNFQCLTDRLLGKNMRWTLNGCFSPCQSSWSCQKTSVDHSGVISHL